MKFINSTAAQSDILDEVLLPELNASSKLSDLRATEIKALEVQMALLEAKKNFLESEDGIAYLSLISPNTNKSQNTKKFKNKSNTASETKLKQLFNMCRTILIKLKKHPNAGPFMQKIDPDKLKCPDYYAFVKNPMDLGTVSCKMRIGNVIYETPLEFRDDIRQIFVNTLLYNPGGHMMYSYGTILEMYFETLWKDSNIEEEFALIVNLNF